MQRWKPEQLNVVSTATSGFVHESDWVTENIFLVDTSL
jgi:hypothetical protein